MYNEEVEKAVLFSIIFENMDYEIREQDFMNNRNIRIAKAIIELRKEKKVISMLSISEKIKANKKQIVEYISHLGDSIYGYNRDENYNILIELSKKRALYNIIQSSLLEIEEAQDIDAYIQQLKDNIITIAKRNEQQEDFMEQITKTIEDIEDVYKNRDDKSLYTGITTLDDLTCGLHKQELTIIGARPRCR